MSTHTPGPWTVTDNFGEGKRLHMVWGSGKLLARTCAEPTSEANARLIAAAPELLDVVKRLMMLHTTFDAERPIAAITSVFDSARAAIAKAEGRPSESFDREREK